jgi:hypothetical protein
VARFTTVDPIRDGANWFAYVNNDPVNWVDLWGLADIVVIRALENDFTPNNTIYNSDENAVFSPIFCDKLRQFWPVRL